MTKSEKLAAELSKLRFNEPLNKKAEIELIKKHFEMVHNEAVDATVMAENKKQFNKPKYND